MTNTALPATLLPGGRVLFYSRLQSAGRDRIAQGEWRAGDQFPTLRLLGDSYGVSHITVVQGQCIPLLSFTGAPERQAFDEYRR
jgi:hypothetical protein